MISKWVFDNIYMKYAKLYEIRKLKREANKANRHYHNVIKQIKSSGSKRIRFAAYVMYDSTYGADRVFCKMLLKLNYWDPKIVIIPDVFRGKEHANELYSNTKTYFIQKYGKEYVIDGYDVSTGEIYNPIDQFDIIYYANPYDFMAHKYHSIQYAVTKNVLPIYISYGYDISRYMTLKRLHSKELNFLWKCFADTTYTMRDYKKYQFNKGKNVILTGYSKMDAYIDCEQDDSNKSINRKKILIAVHHTIDDSELPLSNFLSYNKLILELPKMFPNIDFIFRPHQLLFTNLVTKQIWSKEEVELYLRDLYHSGVEYSSGGEYLKIFAECDALINDCGSFTVEWLYTGKPGCFVQNCALKKRHLTTLMKKSLKYYDIAKSENDIIEFIKKVENGIYKKNNQMSRWVRNNIAVNYPNVSEKILKEIDIYNTL